MRRLPVYLLLDTSGSMKGESIEAVKVGLEAMISTLRQDPFALESVHICIITFDRIAQVLIPLTDVENFQVPKFETPDSGPTHLGEALQLLVDQVKKEVFFTTSEQKGDWRPILFIMTDGSPSDLQKYREMIPKVNNCHFTDIIACAAGPMAKIEKLKELTTNIVSLDTTDSHTFQKFFQWVSASVSMGNMSMGATDKITLPPPPPEVHQVVI